MKLWLRLVRKFVLNFRILFDIVIMTDCYVRKTTLWFKRILGDSYYGVLVCICSGFEKSSTLILIVILLYIIHFHFESVVRADTSGALHGWSIRDVFGF